MASLSREYRRQLERVIIEARQVGEKGARNALKALAVEHHEPLNGSSQAQRDLRNRLRAHGRQLGDKLDPKRGTQTIRHLAVECAYEHWHRMLFARFLAENNLLIEPESGVALSLEECRELAREQNADWLELASSFAVRMLPQIFRQGDPVLEVSLPPETRKKLEELLEGLPAEVFSADDSLGWVYQFWQSELKDSINAAGEKIGADELPAVTQLFTDDYMVLFLLHNTLGAWWTAKRKSEGKDPALPNISWTYLLLNDDGTPAAGPFTGWPKLARDIRLLDPSMGSGHFLTFALPILAAFRMEEEGLTHEDAVDAVLRDNLFGLEIDTRCTQIAAFNLALSAWRPAGYRQLPSLNLACSGIGINAKVDEWLKLAGPNGKVRETMSMLFRIFERAPILASLIDPRRVGGTLFAAHFEDVRDALGQALSSESEGSAVDELAIAAKGVVEATTILCKDFTLVITNVPYLGRGKQSDELREYCDAFHPSAKADLATCFVQRCLRLCEDGGTVAVVTPQNWLFLGGYKTLRQELLEHVSWRAVVRLGEHAFESPQAAGAFAALGILNKEHPRHENRFVAIDLADRPTAEDKTNSLLNSSPLVQSQRDALRNPDCRITFGSQSSSPLLAQYASSYVGLQNGDSPRFILFFWEVPERDSVWEFFQLPCDTTVFYGGRSGLLRWEGGSGQLSRSDGLFIKGREAWGKRGIAIRHMRELPATLYSGDMYDQSSAVIVPRDPALLSAIWEFCSSSEFNESVRNIDRAIKVTNATLVKVPFDVQRWTDAASKRYPKTLPLPESGDPTQWLFAGNPHTSLLPMQIAFARLVGYKWPRQTGSSFTDCPALGPDGLEKHADEDGIVCLASIQGEAPAGERLRALLADAYGKEWSASKQAALLSQVGYAGKSLEDWLRDGFFEQHCELFHQRPFVWHVWDGQRDGFHALVNYHKLAAPNGDGRRTLEKLTYGYLGDWITRQRADQSNGVEGADARVAAAVHLQSELKKIIEGEPPYDIFVRWKPLHEQPIGWEPDINDGVRMNIRPFMTAKALNGRGKGASILRVLPKGIKWDKDRGKEPHRAKEDFPWFWKWDEQTQDFTGGREFDGNRWNDLHYSIQAKKEARERQRKTQNQKVAKK